MYINRLLKIVNPCFLYAFVIILQSKRLKVEINKNKFIFKKQLLAYSKKIKRFFLMQIYIKT